MKILTSFWAGLPRAARIYATAVGALAIAGTAGVVTVAATGMPPLATASPQPSASPGSAANLCDRFLANFASSIGKNQDQVRKAYTDALNKTLDDAVKAGDLTQQQADAIKSRASAAQLCTGALTKRGKSGAGRPGAAARLSISEYAKVLGMSEADLRQQLGSKTLKEIAADKGMDENAFRQKLISVVKPDLENQVQMGRLTQQQADEILKRLESAPLPLWDRSAAKSARPSSTPSPASSSR